jgi:putative mRNA 3-end processing factor
MKLTALGGAKEVGRSGFVFEFDDGKKYLFDYGIKIDGRKQEYPLDSPEVDAILLSHAHLDHTGYIPYYYKTKSAKLLCTKPTYEISWILWEDYLKVCVKNEVEPKYTIENVEEAASSYIPTKYGETINLDGSEITYIDAGHIPGSSMIKVERKGKKVLYSGDVKLKDTELVKGADLSDVDCDIMIIETTYGDRNHPDRKKIEEQFIETIRETLDNKGFVVIPVFAVGRSQEIAMVLYKYRHKINADIYLDGMSRTVSRVILRYKNYIRDYNLLKKSLENTYWVRRHEERKAILKGDPCIILSTAGMLQGGPIIYYLTQLYNDEKSSIIFTGYQAEDTPGRRVLEEQILEVGENEYPVKMKIYQYDFSAHGGQEDLLKLVKLANPEKVVLVHGDPDVIPVFDEKLKEEGFKTIIPEMGGTYEL